MQKRRQKRLSGEVHLRSKGGEKDRQDADVFDEEAIKNSHAVLVGQRHHQRAADNRRTQTHTGPAPESERSSSLQAALIGRHVVLCSPAECLVFKYH